jgi:acetylornithine deacetylase/succinyl-diaminopimelate desuccinylase-like protein
MKHSRIFFFLAASLLTAGAQNPVPDIHKEAIEYLSALVKIDTSNPPGNESRAAQYIKDVLAREGIESQIFESAPGRGNLVARLKGNGAKKPLLLMGHLDVVGVERSRWTVEPFTALVRDGFLYGRGSVDDKSMDAANLAVFLRLKREGTPLDRDVILLAEAGEEGTSQYGIDFMVAQHWDAIACEYALNEGGTFLIGSDGRVKYTAVETTEKVPRTMKLVAHGSSGHGSMPRLDNAIVHLAAAVSKVGSTQQPMRLNETTSTFFARLATISPPEEAKLYTHLDDPQVQSTLQRTNMLYNSMLRTSVVPTILKGGFRENVIPAEAEAELDVRALPDEDIQALMSRLRTLINDPEVAVERDQHGPERPANPASSIHNEMFAALEHAQKQVFTEAITLPLMQTGATDSAQLRVKGVQAYGIEVPFANEELHRMHGNDERVSLQAMDKFTDYLYAVVKEVAGKK